MYLNEGLFPGPTGQLDGDNDPPTWFCLAGNIPEGMEWRTSIAGPWHRDQPPGNPAYWVQVRTPHPQPDDHVMVIDADLHRTPITYAQILEAVHASTSDPAADIVPTARAVWKALHPHEGDTPTQEPQ